MQIKEEEFVLIIRCASPVQRNGVQGELYMVSFKTLNLDMSWIYFY